MWLKLLLEALALVFSSPPQTASYHSSCDRRDLHGGVRRVVATLHQMTVVGGVGVGIGVGVVGVIVVVLGTRHTIA